MQPILPPDGDRTGQATDSDRLKFIRQYLGEFRHAEVEFRQDALNQEPHAVATIERNGKGYLITLQSDSAVINGAAFSVSRLGKVLDRTSGKPLAASPLDEYINSSAPYDVWLSDESANEQSQARGEPQSGYPYNVFAADGVSVTTADSITYLMIAEREVEGSDVALNFSINQVEDSGDLREVRRIFISRDMTDDYERLGVREQLSEALQKLAQVETFDQGLAQIDRLIDAGYLIGSVDPELSIRSSFNGKISVDVNLEGEFDISITPARQVNVQYLEAQPIEDISFFTERDKIFE